MVVIESKARETWEKVEQRHLVNYSQFCLPAVLQQVDILLTSNVLLANVACSLGIFVPCEVGMAQEWVVHKMQQSGSFK